MCKKNQVYFGWSTCYEQEVISVQYNEDVVFMNGGSLLNG